MQVMRKVPPFHSSSRHDSHSTFLPVDIARAPAFRISITSSYDCREIRRMTFGMIPGITSTISGWVDCAVRIEFSYERLSIKNIRWMVNIFLLIDYWILRFFVLIMP